MIGRLEPFAFLHEIEPGGLGQRDAIPPCPRDLDRKIEDELSHPSRDDLYIAGLKRKKLELKDELTRAQANGRH